MNDSLHTNFTIEENTTTTGTRTNHIIYRNNTAGIGRRRIGRKLTVISVSLNLSSPINGKRKSVVINLANSGSNLAISINNSISNKGGNTWAKIKSPSTGKIK